MPPQPWPTGGIRAFRLSVHAYVCRPGLDFCPTLSKHLRACKYVLYLNHFLLNVIDLIHECNKQMINFVLKKVK